MLFIRRLFIFPAPKASFSPRPELIPLAALPAHLPVRPFPGVSRNDQTRGSRCRIVSVPEPRSTPSRLPATGLPSASSATTSTGSKPGRRKVDRDESHLLLRKEADSSGAVRLPHDWRRRYPSQADRASRPRRPRFANCGSAPSGPRPIAAVPFGSISQS